MMNVAVYGSGMSSTAYGCLSEQRIMYVIDARAAQLIRGIDRLP
jgi:hypothetical protein